MIPDDYKYLHKTFDNNDVKAIYQDRYGYLNIVAYRPKVNDYFVARAYDPTTGKWQEGSYMWETFREANNVLLDGKDGPYYPFDVNNEMMVRNEYDAQFNWNETYNEWLKVNDPLNPDYERGQMENSGFGYYAEHGYNDDKKYPKTIEGFREFKHDYRKYNAPQRKNFSLKGRENRRRARR